MPTFAGNVPKRRGTYSLEGEHMGMTSNYTLERPGNHRGPPLSAQEMVRSAPAISGVAGRSAKR